MQTQDPGQATIVAVAAALADEIGFPGLPLAAAARALRDFAPTYPGRHAATFGLAPSGPDDPIAIAALQGLGPFTAVLRGYDIAPQEMTHALRSVFRDFATLRATGGSQWSTDVGESFAWLIACR